MIATEAAMTNFAKHFVVLPNGCWLWTGARGGRRQAGRRWRAKFGEGGVA